MNLERNASRRDGKKLFASAPCFQVVPLLLSWGASIRVNQHHAAAPHGPRQGYVEDQTCRCGYAKRRTAIIDRVDLSVRTVIAHGDSPKAQGKVGPVNSSLVRDYRLR